MRTRKYLQQNQGFFGVGRLQWGRVVEDAEVSTHWRRTNSIHPLQWGRVVEDAEVSALALVVLGDRVASMGPRR